MELIKQAPVIWNLLFLNKSCKWLPDKLLLGCDADAMLSKEAKDRKLSAKGKNYVIHMRSNPTFCAWEKRNGVSITQERSWLVLKEADKKGLSFTLHSSKEKRKESLLTHIFYIASCMVKRENPFRMCVDGSQKLESIPFIAICHFCVFLCFHNNPRR